MGASEGFASSKEAAVPIESLEKLIETLENPEKKEALLPDLKTLQELQRIEPKEEIPESEKPNVVERFILGYGQITRETSGFIQGLFDLVRRGPGTARKLTGYLSAPENRATLYRTAMIIGVRVVTALLWKRFLSFPHRTLYWGELKTGEAPPLAIQMTGGAMGEGEERA